MSDLQHLLSLVPVHDSAKTAIVHRLEDTNRHYHNLEHVLEMWRWHCEFSRGRFTDEIVASFCLYHDAYYDPQDTTNEQRSTGLWRLDSTVSGFAHWKRAIVTEAILASANHFHALRQATTGDRNLEWCLNLDLLRLGSPEHEFIQHGHNIHAEYRHLDDLAWAQASCQFRSKAMAQPMIFTFPEFSDFERQARRNLANALVRDWRDLGWLDQSDKC